MKSLVRAGFSAALTLSAAALLTACEGGGDSTTTATGPSCGSNSIPTNLGLYVEARDAKNNLGYTDGYSADLSSCLLSFRSGLGEGIAVDLGGTLYAVGAPSNSSSALLGIFPNIASRDGTGYNPASGDLEYPLRFSRQPEGIRVTNYANTTVIMIADAGEPTGSETSIDLAGVHIVQINVNGGSTSTTQYSLLQNKTLGPVWGLAYDRTRDRLFAAREDAILVFDRFLNNVINNNNLPTPNRFITPGQVNADGNSVSIVKRLRGIVYDYIDDQLVITDAGDPGVADGALYVINNAALSFNNPVGTGVPIVQVNRIVTGATSRLTDPSDAAYSSDGAHLYIADPGAQSVFVFDNFVNGTGSVAPDSVLNGDTVGLDGVPAFVAVPLPIGQ